MVKRWFHDEGFKISSFSPAFITIVPLLNPSLPNKLSNLDLKFDLSFVSLPSRTAYVCSLVSVFDSKLSTAMKSRSFSVSISWGFGGIMKYIFDISNCIAIC